MNREGNIPPPPNRPLPQLPTAPLNHPVPAPPNPTPPNLPAPPNDPPPRIEDMGEQPDGGRGNG